MILTLSPQVNPKRLTASCVGDTLTLNGVAYDFGQLADGDTLPRGAVDCEWLASDVTRIGSALHLTLSLPHSMDAPHETRFPDPIAVTEDGPIALPPYEVTA